jgi:hypothetical protein
MEFQFPPLSQEWGHPSVDDSVSVIAFRVYTHGFRSLSAGSAGTLVIARATGQRHAAMTDPSFAHWRDN